jgi:hypothetical protein
MAALYLELWPPDDAYADLIRWIDRSRAVSAGRATVIAAYVPALRDAGSDPAARARAIESAAILTSIIHAGGAFHHVLAEHDRLLVEGYYPAAVPLHPAEVRELRAAWRFAARYLHLLSDPRSVRVDAFSVRLRDRSGVAVPVSRIPRAGAVWVTSSRTPSGEVTSLIDLREAADDRWTSAQPPAPSNRGWRVAFDEPGSTRSAGTTGRRAAMSPWTRGGDALPLSEASDSWSRLPTFRRWIVIHRPTNPA